MIGWMHILVFMALPCGGRHRKQGHVHAIHMVPFLAPIARHHAQPIFITPASLTMHRPASVVPLEVEGGVEDWKGATRHVLHLIWASCTIAPLKDHDPARPQLHHAWHMRVGRRLQGVWFHPFYQHVVAGFEGCPRLGPTPPPH